MSSSPLSSSLSSPSRTKAEELPAGDDLDEEQEEVEEEQDEEEADEEEGEEIEEDEEIEDKNMHGHARPTQTDQHETQPEPPNLEHPRQRNAQRNRKVHNQKVIGTTILPVTRVTRAAKQDKDIKIVSKEAVFLISIATEFFVKKLTDSAFERAKRERRVFVKYNDVASAVKRNPEYNWLEEVIPTSLPLGTLLRDPTIPSSSTAVTNRLPTEALAQSSDLSSKPPSQALLTGSSNTYSFEPDSLANPELPSVAHDGMDLDDQDELDEEI
ncbi:hypothetical protein PCANC_02967 [Puccinia coronata f. sp. avenae]|uniref:Transcription factor CBF/NF-Y/archaeal histone domain-containing protein n=1 Tax=Puccinia coronata f. sp. avenae TaxID=200324 RepID=A0A2N5U4H5_9BASI|nr:hypothetical protein PCANC_09199 [Puccinia coronata f. sp. avenae]PLW32654.1 hypothetical protein PCASD_13349 [Puccinia coronata f. sp. avenae]PLW55994.1 hypothetical protein PCANC_02967 [Puccinia coronata f. sp. avenae]